MDQRFDSVILIGSGDLFRKCANYCGDFGFNIEVYNTNTNAINNFAIQESSKYSILDFKDNIDVINMRKDTCLIISVVCNFIFPNSFVEKENFTIINYHNSLLPVHRGRNAEAWAIYEQDKKTGITWHIVDNDVDTGDILIQKEVEISEDMTSLKLLKQQNHLAFEAFKEIFPKLLIGDYQVYKNNKLPNSLHLSTDVPNDGFLNLEWPFSKIKAFIKAMDYSFLQTLGIPKVMYNNELYTWDKALFSIDNGDNQIIYEKENNCLILIKEQKKLTLKNFISVVRRGV